MVFLSWCFCGVFFSGVFCRGGVVVFLWWCFCVGVFVVVFLWWCFCGSVLVVVFFVLLNLCVLFAMIRKVGKSVFSPTSLTEGLRPRPSWHASNVQQKKFLWWCFCGGVVVVLFLWWCFCGGVLWWWCGGVFCRGGVVVFLWWCSAGGLFDFVNTTVV